MKGSENALMSQKRQLVSGETGITLLDEEEAVEFLLVEIHSKVRTAYVINNQKMDLKTLSLDPRELKK